MKKSLLGLLIGGCLLISMVGCSNIPKEVNGKQIEVVMEKKIYDVDDCEYINNYLNQQISKYENYSFFTTQITMENSKEVENKFLVRVDIKNIEYGHDKETVDYIDKFKFISKELELAFKGTDIEVQVRDGNGTRIAYYDKKTEKMVLDF